MGTRFRKPLPPSTAVAYAKVLFIFFFPWSVRSLDAWPYDKNVHIEGTVFAHGRREGPQVVSSLLVGSFWEESATHVGLSCNSDLTFSYVSSFKS
ncbi:hypothetical protein GGS23DRAFT_49160 [Durotheca rogersii]|uniref:uncharacterized protein n=1 Tax=Durotheca rogersii TaxID=419775 RepID=UPI0022201477|nr:uncharacterized protein GGS23DRAFT_49160 [Durotheca rogersii]KAI5863029.1 hypothetical protein GGS23DRAFT_49160 [Durotheca rogersii]